MKIVVLAGGLSPERNVSLSSGAMVCQALRDRGHQVALVDLFFGLDDWDKEPEALYGAPIPEEFLHVSRQAPDLDQVRASRKTQSPSAIGPGVLDLCAGADVVYLALHGACGEDGRIQAALDLLGVPYTGSGYLGSAIAMDKDLTKQLVAGKVTTPKWQTVTVTEENVDALTAETQLPVVVKPIASGSSIGVFIAKTRQELRHALTESIRLGGRTVLEQYVQGREIQVACWTARPCPPSRSSPSRAFMTMRTSISPARPWMSAPLISPRSGRKKWARRLSPCSRRWGWRCIPGRTLSLRRTEPPISWRSTPCPV